MDVRSCESFVAPQIDALASSEPWGSDGVTAFCVDDVRGTDDPRRAATWSWDRYAGRVMASDSSGWSSQGDEYRQ